MINKFDGQYDFLSNFYETKILYNGLTYENAEAAFQAQKTLDIEEQKSFTNIPPNIAKRKGRKVQLRLDWELVKDKIMEEICFAKFNQNKELKEKLLNTNNEMLIEGNYWHDNYWGICTCEKCQKENKGKNGNHLGMILMKIRSEL